MNLRPYVKPLDPWGQETFIWITRNVQVQLDEPGFKEAWSAGRGLTLEQAIEEARQVTA